MDLSAPTAEVELGVLGQTANADSTGTCGLLHGSWARRGLSTGHGWVCFIPLCASSEVLQLGAAACHPWCFIL